MLVAVATLVVNSGERLPAENDVTVPPPLGVELQFSTVPDAV